MGDTNGAITNLQKALRERDVWLTFHVMTDPDLDPVRQDPRFHAILGPGRSDHCHPISAGG
jgi:hypothetical protein